VKRRKHPSRFSSGEHFAAVHEDVITSEAFRWIPHFARSVLIAIAGRYRGFNNGGLELTVALAKERGINKSELYAGIRLCMHVGLLKQTSPGKRRSGKGIPAKYALTWKPMNEFLSLNLIESDRPSDKWIGFKPTGDPIRSLSQAERFLGMRKKRSRREPVWPVQESIEVSEPTHTKTQLKSVTPQTKQPHKYGPLHTTGAVSTQTKKKQHPTVEASIG
jgi:hypothetical protein